MNERSPALDYATEKIRDIPGWKSEHKGWAPLRFKSKMTSGESHLLYRTARQLGPGNYADVGVYRGASTSCLAAGLRDGGHHGTIYAVDLFARFGPDDDIEQWSDNEYTPELLRYYFEEHHSDVHLQICAGDSFDFGVSLNLPFKLVFIDADHSHEGCMRDYVAWERLIEPGGMLAFHDTHLPGVARVVEEIDPWWELVHHIYSTKMFQCKR